MKTLKMKGTNTFIVKICHKERQHKCNKNYKTKAVSGSLMAKENLIFFKDKPGYN